jgi:predicted  nucleic acid-binding Zn-ribbon protein
MDEQINRINSIIQKTGVSELIAELQQQVLKHEEDINNLEIELTQAKCQIKALRFSPR